MDVFGQTPLMWAARKALPECLEELIKFGADVHVVGELGTALQWAETVREPNCIEMLKAAEDPRKRPSFFRRLWLRRPSLKRQRSQIILLSEMYKRFPT